LTDVQVHKLLPVHPANETILESPRGTRVTVGQIQQYLQSTEGGGTPTTIPAPPGAEREAAMKHSRILIFLMLLSGFLFPAAARALDTPSMGEAISDMNKIEHLLVQYDVIPQDVANSYGDIMNIFSCIDTAKDEVTVMKCIDKFKDTYIGGALLQAVPSWFWDLLDVYIDIRTLNIPELFLNLAEAAVCAIVEALAWGIDICGIIDAFIDVGEDLDAIAKAVVKFAEEIGSAAWHSVKCTIKPSSCEDKLTGVQIAWRDFFQNILTSNQGLNWRLTPPYSSYCLAGAPSGGQAASLCPQDYYMDHVFCAATGGAAGNSYR
jgi:hypothetical protein